MFKENIDGYWEFVEGKPFMIPGYGQTGKIVHLPHDFTIETDTNSEAPGGQMTGYYGGGVGTYTKMLEISKEYEGKRVLVEFDGVYMNPTVILNGHVVARQHYGYSPFHADLTPYIKPGKKNRLAVTVNNEAQPNSRWYSGSGIYRHVDLITAPKTHIAPWGIYAYTSHVINGTAFVMVETTVENHTDEDKNMWVDIQMTKENDNTEAAIGKVKVYVPAGGNAVAKIKIAVEHVELWDIDSPNLYKITAMLRDKESVIDSEFTAFGIRTISVDAINGFVLNGKTLKLKGGCVHHDNGILGAKSFKDSEYRRMKIHKDNGFNAIRFSHNPMSRDMLDACDRLGLLVINEAFDVWTMEKNTHDYSQYFESDWQKDLESFILRDRNHPCVIMWSTGNEVAERGGLSNGYSWAAKLADFVRKLDPIRPIINSLPSFFNGLEDEDQSKFFQDLMKNSQKQGGGIINLDGEFGQNIWSDYTEAFAAPLDVVGYNYLIHQYEKSTKYFPNRVICSTESKPMEMLAYWREVERLPNLIGDFTWTSLDYIGEAGLGKQDYYNDPEEAANMSKKNHVSEYPWRLAGGADIDLCGFERPQLAYRRIVWGSEETYIATHNPENYKKIEVLGRWAWPERENHWSWAGYEGKPIQVDIYSAAEEVELILDGKSLGRKPAGRENKLIAQFELIFEPGILEAISYTNDKKVSYDKLITSGKPTGIRITPDKKEIPSDGQSLIHAIVEVIDEEGKLVPSSELKATAQVIGAATLEAFGTGKPQTSENYTTGIFTSYKGKLLAIIRAGDESGEVDLTINMDGIGSSSTKVTVK